MTRSRICAICVMLSCGGGAPPASPIGSRVGPALAAALGAFDQARTPVPCAASGRALADETLALRKTWQLAGSTVKTTATGTIAIGVIADAGGAAAPTLAALGRLKARLAEVDLILALGGMGGTQAELEATLGVLAEDSRAPVIAIAGDLEPAPALALAIGKLRARGRPVLDAKLVRTIELPGATIATLPGARSVSRLVAGSDGCAYTAADVSALLAGLTPRAGLRIMATAEAPRTTVRGEPTGELAITPGTLHQVDLVLHGPVSEVPTPAKTGARDAAATALTPGTSDATTRLPDRHVPSAGILTIDGASWRWKPVADR